MLYREELKCRSYSIRNMFNKPNYTWFIPFCSNPFSMISTSSTFDYFAITILLLDLGGPDCVGIMPRTFSTNRPARPSIPCPLLKTYSHQMSVREFLRLHNTGPYQTHSPWIILDLVNAISSFHVLHLPPPFALVCITPMRSLILLLIGISVSQSAYTYSSSKSYSSSSYYSNVDGKENSGSSSSESYTESDSNGLDYHGEGQLEERDGKQIYESVKNCLNGHCESDTDTRPHRIIRRH